MRPPGRPRDLERRRRRAIALLQRGLSPAKVATRIRVDPRSVRRWRASHGRHGIRGLAARRTPGRPPKLTDRQRSRLERYLRQGAGVMGYSTDEWTAWQVAQLIRERFGVRYHPDHVGRILHRLGWRYEKRLCRPYKGLARIRVRSWSKGDQPPIRHPFAAFDRMRRIKRRSR